MFMFKFISAFGRLYTPTTVMRTFGIGFTTTYWIFIIVIFGLFLPFNRKLYFLCKSCIIFSNLS